MTLAKKSLAMFYLVFSLAFIGALAVPEIDFFGGTEAHADLKDDIKSNNGTTKIEGTVNKAGDDLIKLIREIAFVVAMVFVVWMGISLWFKKSAESLADMKGRLGVLVLALAFVFFAEQILGALFGMFGYTFT